MAVSSQPTPRVVVIGGGFGGINVAKRLKHAPVSVVLIDRRNYHLFQPLLPLPEEGKDLLIHPLISTQIFQDLEP